MNMPSCITSEYPLASVTTLKVGGTARYFATVTSLEEVKAVVAFAEERRLPLFVLGGGSNVLAPDGQYDGVVMHIGLKGRSVEQLTENLVQVTIGAGEVLDELIAYTVEEGWWGLENLSAIPGSVGAAPVQNVGAYGVEASQLITYVEVYDRRTHIVRVLSSDECRFGYRDSIFKHVDGASFIVTSVTFALNIAPKPILHYKDVAEVFGVTQPTQQAIRAAIIDIRRNKFPDWTVVGTAGSFFKNPIVPTQKAQALLASYPLLPQYDATPGYKKISLGYVLDKVCHLKGYSNYGVGLYEKQALVLVVSGNATSDDVKKFAHEVSEKVFRAIDVQIEWEVVCMK